MRWERRSLLSPKTRLTSTLPCTSTEEGSFLTSSKITSQPKLAIFALIVRPLLESVPDVKMATTLRALFASLA